MFNPLKRFQEWREERLYKTLSGFAHARPHLLVIVCDPKTDTIFAAHHNKQTFNKVKGFDGKKSKVIREVLSHSRFKTSIDGFLGVLAETLGLSIPDGNQFYQVVDGVLFNIAKALRMERVARRLGIGKSKDDSDKGTGINPPTSVRVEPREQIVA